MAMIKAGVWFDTWRGVWHEVFGNVLEDGHIVWSTMTRCRHVRTIPLGAVKDMHAQTVLTCLYCVGLPRG